MQPFMKMKKKTGMTESTRQVLNKAIDLLHRLSNKKISDEEARKDLSTALSTHFLSEGGVEAEKKIQLQVVLEEANEVITQLDKGKIPLYEAIMLVNRIVVTGAHKEPPPLPEDKIEPKLNRAKIEPYEEDLEFVSQQFDLSGGQLERNLHTKIPVKVEEKIVPPAPKQSEEDISTLINKVLLNKKLLEDSIVDLNGTLQSIGFELRPIGK